MIFLKRWKLLAISPLVLISACGPKPASLTSTAAQQFSASAPNQAVSYRLTWKLTEPPTFGAAWTRTFQLQSTVNPTEDMHGWSVEKRNHGGDAWQAVGFTDAAGLFVDHYINLEAEYTFGRIVNSGLLGAVSDSFLYGNFPCENKVYKAYRWILPPDQVWTLGQCNLDIQAQILVVDGQIRAFDPQTLGGLDAGVLDLEVNTLTGHGSIDWRGQTGSQGAQGATGTIGQDGDPSHFCGWPGGQGFPGLRGLSGGKGGFIRLQVTNLFFNRFNVQGGAGGPGGPGGCGGRGGFPWIVEHHMVGVTHKPWALQLPGPPGARGPMGPIGVQGLSGQVEIVTGGLGSQESGAKF